MDFGANKMPIEVIRQATFGNTYFRDIYSSLNGKWYRKSWWTFLVCKNHFLFMLILLGGSSKMHFLREQFWSAPMFWNGFFEGGILKPPMFWNAFLEKAIILISWFMAAD